MPTSPLAILLTVISTMISAIGGVAFKKSSEKISLRPSILIRNYKFILGLILFGLSAAIYIVALTQGELNVLYPISSLTYVWSLFLGKLIFKEKLNSFKFIGMALIVIGALVIPK